MKTTTIRARIDAETKAGVESILNGLGLTPSSAINMFFRQIILNKGLPFEIRIPNEETIQAIQDSLAGDVETFDSKEGMFNSLRMSECEKLDSHGSLNAITTASQGKGKS